MHESFFDEDLRLFQDSFRKWLYNEVVPQHEKWEENGICSREIYRKAGEQGFLLINQPSEFGGQGLDFRFSAVLTEELALAGVTGLPLWLHSDIIAPYIEHFGTQEQKTKWLNKMASGECISAIAMTEPETGSDLQGIQTRAQRDGNCWILNGSKTFISNGQNADLVIVIARTDDNQNKYASLSLFLVEAGTVGFEKGRRLNKLGIKAQDTTELSFTNCRIPSENLLGEAGQGFIYLTKSLARERLCMAIHCVASARRALNMTVKYVKERKAFGQPIAKFQNTKFKLAECATEIEVCQAFLDQCVMSIVRNEDITVSASMAKAKCSEMLCMVTDECLQLFGGYGYMLEYPISKAYADARVQRIFGGTTEIMKEIISRSIL